MEKILFINTPLDEMKESEDSLPPLSLGYIAKQLENDFNIELLDAFYEALSVKEILEKITLIEPYAIILNVFTPNIETVKKILKKIKKNIKIFIGGLVTKDIYEDIFEWNIKNELNIIIGEGEFIIPQILKGNNSIITYDKKNEKQRVYVVGQKENEKYFPNELKSLSIKRDIFKNGAQVNKYGQLESYIITTRGCPHNCAFCGAANNNNDKFFLHKIRYLTKKQIIEEIKNILELYPKVKSIRILDDLFLSNKKRVEEAIEIFKNFSLEWRAMIHYNSFQYFEEKTYIELKKSGCKELFIGIESGDEDILKKINKERKNSNLLNYIEFLLQNNINVKGYFIYGFPYETEENMTNTYNLFLKIKDIEKKYNKGNFEPSVFIFRPYHGTSLYKEAQEVMKKNKYKKEKIDSKTFHKKIFNQNLYNYSSVSDEVLKKFINKTK